MRNLRIFGLAVMLFVASWAKADRESGPTLCALAMTGTGVNGAVEDLGEQGRFLTQIYPDRVWVETAAIINAFQYALLWERDRYQTPYNLLRETVGLDRRHTPIGTLFEKTVDLAYLIGESMAPESRVTVNMKRIEYGARVQGRPEMKSVRKLKLSDLGGDEYGAKFMTGVDVTNTGESIFNTLLVLKQDGPKVHVLDSQNMGLQVTTLIPAEDMERQGRPLLRLEYKSGGPAGVRYFVPMAVTHVALEVDEAHVSRPSRGEVVNLNRFDVEFSRDGVDHKIWRTSDGQFRLFKGRTVVSDLGLREAKRDGDWFDVTLEQTKSSFNLTLDPWQKPAQVRYGRHLRVHVNRKTSEGYVEQVYRDRTGVDYGWPGEANWNHRLGSITASDVR